MKRIAVVLLLVLCAAAQAADDPLDGPKRILHDDLLKNLAGKWKTKDAAGNWKPFATDTLRRASP